MSLLKRIAPLRSLHRAFTRVIKFESVPAFDQADHMSNMSTKDIFQFEPFANEDLIVHCFCLLSLELSKRKTW